MMRAKLSSSSNLPSSTASSCTDKMHSSDADPPRPSSRLAAFAPFRRSTHLHATLHRSEQTAAPFSSGGVADVPAPVHSSSYRVPLKPPKPVALRVKKAKALSISLLDGGQQGQAANGGGGQDRGHQAYYVAPAYPATAHPASRQMSLQEALAAEGSDGRYPSINGNGEKRSMPPRSVSSVDFYRSNGPTKGLAKASKVDLQTQKQPATSPLRARQGTDELFIIARPADDARSHIRRRSLSHKPNAEQPSSHHSPEPPPSSPQGWRLDTARELLSAQRYVGPLRRTVPSAASPQANDRAYAPASVSKLPMRTQTASTASPFLNTYTARAKMGAEFHSERQENGDGVGQLSQVRPSLSPSRIPKRTPVPASLGKSDILRSTHRSSSDYSAPSSPQASIAPTTPRRTPSHSRTPSASELTPSPNSRPNMRSRTQSLAFGAPVAARLDDGPDVDWNSDRLIPTHPLSARESSFVRGHEDAASEGQPHQSAPRTIAPPPVRRHRLTRLSTHDGLSGAVGAVLVAPSTGRNQSDDRHRTSNGPAGSTSLQSLGQQIGGMGAAVGRRGWDMFKQWGAGANGAASLPLDQTVSAFPRRSIAGNEATRRWLAALNSDAVTNPGHLGGMGLVFGRPLREAVLMTRLGRDSHKDVRLSSSGKEKAQITALDLGTEFSIDLPDLQETSASDSGLTTGPQLAVALAADRTTARLKYLPGVVVRCIEMIELRGVEEEGIYRLSGRSSHTARLRQFFDAPSAQPRSGQGAELDLRLIDIEPLDLDLNSVCSMLKAYLRSLADSIIPQVQATELNVRLLEECGISAAGLGPQLDAGAGDRTADAALEQATAIKAAAGPASTSDTTDLSAKIARTAAGTIKDLPAANWYLLREVALHLADMTRADVVAQTRMPLSNLCLVLAPTLSISVPLLRALVEQRKLLFDNSKPSTDAELDELEVAVPSSKRQQLSDVTSQDMAHIDGLRLPPSGLDLSKRASTVTVTERDMPNSIKRQSTSSVVTLQPPVLPFRVSRLEDGQARPSFDSRMSATLLEEDDPTLFSSPIAAHFVRQRKASVSTSLDSPVLGSSADAPFYESRRRSSSVLLQASGLKGPSQHVATDHDSIRSSAPSMEGQSSAASSLVPSTSSESLRSVSALAVRSDPRHSSSSVSSISALDRPRPPTGTSGKFMSGSRPTATPLGRHGLAESSTGNLSLRSSNHSLRSNDGPTTPVAQRRDAIDESLISLSGHRHHGAGGHAASHVLPVHDRTVVDDAPLDVKAVRQYWNANANAQHRQMQ